MTEIVTQLSIMFDTGLNQNRLNGGVGRQLTKESSLTLSVLWQHRPNADFWRLVVGYAHNLDLRSGEGR